MTTGGLLNFRLAAVSWPTDSWSRRISALPSHWELASRHADICGLERDKTNEPIFIVFAHSLLFSFNAAKGKMSVGHRRSAQPVDKPCQGKADILGITGGGEKTDAGSLLRAPHRGRSLRKKQSVRPA